MGRVGLHDGGLQAEAGAHEADLSGHARCTLSFVIVCVLCVCAFVRRLCCAYSVLLYGQQRGVVAAVARR